MPQQVNSFSGTSFRALPTYFHLPKSIDWKVAGCFTLVAGCLIFLALRFMRPASNNPLGRSTTGSASLSGRVDKHLPGAGSKLGSRGEEGSSATPSPTHEIKPSDESASLSGRVDKHLPDAGSKLGSRGEEGSSATPSPTHEIKPSDPRPSAVASASAPPRQVTKDGWTVSSVDGKVTVSFSMNSNDVLDATKQRVTERGGSVLDAFGEYKRWLKSEVFTVDGEEYYLSFRHNEENIDEMRFSLEKIKASNSTKAGHSLLDMKYVYQTGNNEPQEGTKPLDFSKESSLTLLTPRRTNRIARENMIIFTVTFLQPKTS